MPTEHNAPFEGGEDALPSSAGGTIAFPPLSNHVREEAV
jgi:hypothetical protein